jgi:putative spermidine/putrescine transport system ATP-binding protein
MISVPLGLRDISKSYGQVQALKPLSLDVAGGEMLALLGPSGCGKTTTLRAIAGFEQPDTGAILIGGRDITDLPPNRRELGMVFQNYSLFPHMSVGENVAFGLKMRGTSRAEREDRARRLLAMVRLDQFGERQIHQLSGGQQQRVALARALATDPKILLLDEPLGALDKNLRESMQFELRAIQRRLGITSILVTHDQEEALTMSDRVAVMSAGEIVQIGAPAEIYGRPATRFVADFLGTANVFSGTAVAEQGAGVWRVALSGGERVEVTVTATKPLSAGQPVAFAVRPERLVMGSPESVGLPARIRDVVFRGSFLTYELDAEGRDTPIFVYSQSRTAAVAGSAVRLSFEPDCAILLEAGA